eukprot:2957067-Rhodomonas_salina.1
MVEASVFGFFCGRWQEGVRTSLYIEDIDPATIAAYFDTYNADSSAASTPTKCKPSDYVTSPDRALLGRVMLFQSARTATYGDSIVEFDTRHSPLGVSAVNNNGCISIAIGQAVVYKFR